VDSDFSMYQFRIIFIVIPGIRHFVAHDNSVHDNNSVHDRIVVCAHDTHVLLICTTPKLRNVPYVTAMDGQFVDNKFIFYKDIKNALESTTQNYFAC